MDATELDKLLRQGETPNVEIKGPCAFEGDMRAHLAISIGAMANIHGGGTLVVGVENGTWVVQGLSTRQIATFDSTRVSQYLKGRLVPLPRFSIERVDHPDGIVLIIAVPEFEDVPIIVSKQIEGPDNKRTYAREGDILIRSLTCECRRINSSDEVRELISRAMTKRSEALLTQIKAIMTGVPPTLPSTPPEDLFATTLPDWTPTLETWVKQHPECAWWEVNLLPIPPLDLPLQPQDVIELIRKSAVRWRGWYYPTYGVHNQDFAYLQHHARLAFANTRVREQWQASYIGAFASAHIVPGDLQEDRNARRHSSTHLPFLDYIDICWTLTEFFRFAASLAEGLGCESLWVRIALRNILGRPLGASDPRLGFFGNSDVSQMPDVVQVHVFPAAELASSWRELSLDWTKRILTVFQWPEASREALAAHQARLIERRW